MPCLTIATWQRNNIDARVLYNCNIRRCCWLVIDIGLTECNCLSCALKTLTYFITFPSTYAIFSLKFCLRSTERKIRHTFEQMSLPTFTSYSYNINIHLIDPPSTSLSWISLYATKRHTPIPYPFSLSLSASPSLSRSSCTGCSP